MGIGVDAHQIVPNRELWLGGVKFDCDFGLEAHSDGDVLSHAILEALLGAANLGDKGKLFPPSDDAYKDIRSTKLLRRAMERVRSTGYEIGNVDVSVMCERPKLGPRVREIQRELAAALDCSAEQVSIKGTTLERLGFTGREEGIAALAVALLVKAK